MGYTHYWQALRNVKPAEWRQIVAATTAIIELAERAGIPIRGPEGRWQADKDRISLNGDAGDAHEPFNLTRDIRHGGSNFCKTACKPYDIVVVAILCSLNKLAPGAFTMSSDGTAEEWQDGLDLARRAGVTGVTIPATIRV